MSWIFQDNMDYIDYQLQKNVNIIHFWYKARKKLIFSLLNTVYSRFDKNRKILDIGSGTGVEIEELMKFGNVTALDLNQEAIKILKQQYQCDTIIGNIELLELPSNQYDCVCCFDIFEHLKKDEIALKKIYNSLKPNGFLIFTVPAHQFIYSCHDKTMGHYRRYKKRQIVNVLKLENFKIIKIGYWNFILFFPIVILRLTKKLLLYKKTYSSEAKQLAVPLNYLLYKILNIDNYLISKNLNLPIGLSIYGICKK